MEPYDYILYNHTKIVCKMYAQFFHTFQFQ